MNKRKKFNLTARSGSKILGGAVLLIAVAVFLIFSMRVSAETTAVLPGDESFSDKATVSVSRRHIADIQLIEPETGTVAIQVHRYGSTKFTVRDESDDGGFRQGSYSLEIYQDGDVLRTQITLIGWKTETP